MSVKSKTSLFRDFLYLHEVINHGKISAAAQKNGIKPSNLSNIIKNLEKISGKKLFVRHCNGLEPTSAALKLDKQIFQLENCLNKTAADFLSAKHAKNVLLYLPENIRFENLDEFSRSQACNIQPAETPEQADVVVSYSPITNPEMIVVENTIGRQARQTIWIAAVNRENPLRLAEYLVCAVHG